MTDGFLSRWSKRKLDVQSGKPVVEEPPAQPTTPLPSASEDSRNQPGAAVSLPAASNAPSEPPPEPPAPVLTLADAQGLTPASDFKPFMARGVAAEVKNAAMKKLFADPHFNVMDRLDTYIDDYSLADPIPESMLRQMASAKFLKLFDEEDKPEALRDDADTPAPQDVAQSNPAIPSEFSESSPAHDHTDLRLQPDDAAEPPGSGRGAA